MQVDNRSFPFGCRLLQYAAYEEESRVLVMLKVRQWLAYVAIRLVICVVQAVPLSNCHAGARLLATLFNDVLRLRRKTIAENLAHAFGELSDAERQRLAWRMWEHLFLFAAEVAHTPRRVHETNWRSFVEVTGGELLVRLLLEDRALIMVSAHFGNFELCGYVMALFGYQTHAVARTLDNPYLDEWINRFRGSTGQKILSKRGDYERIVDLLAAGGIIGFLADQYAGTKGCWVQFFGRPASAHKAIALFSLHNDAPVVVGACRRVGGPLEYRMELTAMADPRHVTAEVSGMRELTQWYTSELEKIVRRAPEQYWWLHRRWKDHRPAKKRARQAA
jgi:KDO2-lipid IV(A) lauroyltransferase